MSKKNEVITAIDTLVTKGDDFLTKAKDFISCVEICRKPPSTFQRKKQPMHFALER